MEEQQIKNIVEAGLLVAGRPLSIAQIHALFQDDKDAPDKPAIREALASLQAEYETRGIELAEVASGFRLQSRQEMAPWMMHLFQEKSPRYSRALLETLVLIAYKQPITRAEIEEVRGVAVSSNIVRTLQERNWVNVVGHKDLPGKPALLGTTREFLDYFNLKRLDDLPTLGEIKDITQIDSFAKEEAALIEQGLIQAPTETKGDVEGEGVETNDDGSIAAKAIAVGGVDIALTEDDEELKASDANEASEELEAINSDEASEENEAINSDEASEEPEAINSDEASEELEAINSDEASEELEAINSDEASEELEANSDAESAESQLRQVLDDFASEHQQQVDVQLEIETRNLSKPVGPAAANNNDDGQPSANTDAGDAQANLDSNDQSNEDVTEEASLSEVEELEEALEGSANSTGAQQSSDLPKPGDTLH